MVYKKYVYNTHINTQILNSQMDSWFLLQVAVLVAFPGDTHSNEAERPCHYRGDIKA